jgi:putative oxidoreductase
MDIALLIVRLVGLGFAAHGAQKLFGWYRGYGLAGTGGFFESLGFRPGRLFAAAAGASELAGGLLVALGLLGPIGPMLIVSVMVVAAVAVHAPNGFFAPNGFELPAVYAALAVLLAFTGYGAYSLDAALGLSQLSQPGYAAIAIGLGVLGGLGNLAVRRKPAQAPAAH